VDFKDVKKGDVETVMIQRLLILCIAAGCTVLSSCTTQSKSKMALPLTAPPEPTVEDGWQNLLANGLAEFQRGVWTFENGEMTTLNAPRIRDTATRRRYGDFILDLDFKVAPEANSGIFIRTADPNDQGGTAIEIQILDSWNTKRPDKHDCGAVYDCVAPSVYAYRPAGEWNRMTITAVKNKIYVLLNDKQIIDMDLDRWTTAHRNPDGTENKFNTAYKDMPRIGYIEFQNKPGPPVWYRNIWIKPLSR
jgi:hypothetical protein